MIGTIITCGVYGFTAETFERTVVDAEPDVFVDIRRRRGVRGSQYSFANSQRLQTMLANHDITYVHRIELAAPEAAMKREGEIDRAAGIARHDRDHLSKEFIADYQHEVLDDFDAAAFIDSLGDVQRVLLLCVERTPGACHRELLAEAIVEQLGWERLDLVPYAGS